MQSANEPAERHLVIENLQTVPCLARGRHVKESQQNSSDNLEHEHRECGAAEDVSPARRLARDRMLHGLANRCRQAEGAASNQAPTSFDQAHGGLPAEILIRRAVGDAGGGHLARVDQQIPMLHLVAIFKQAALRRPGGAGTVRIVDAAVARAHEQARLREPTDRTTQMRAIDREDLELLSRRRDAPSRECSRFLHPMGRGADSNVARRVSPSGNLLERAEREPGFIPRVSVRESREREDSARSALRA